MEQYNHTQYMEQVASMHKDIGHKPNHRAFALANTIQLFEGLTESLNSIHFPCLVVINDFTLRLTDRLSDNLLKEPFYQFAVLFPASINDTISQEQARNNASAICDSVLSRMFRHQRSKLKGLDHLQRDGIRYEGIGPVADGAYGCLVSFTIVKPAQIAFEPNDWIDGGTL